MLTAGGFGIKRTEKENAAQKNLQKKSSSAHSGKNKATRQPRFEPNFAPHGLKADMADALTGQKLAWVGVVARDPKCMSGFSLAMQKAESIVAAAVTPIDDKVLAPDSQGCVRPGEARKQPIRSEHFPAEAVTEAPRPGANPQGNSDSAATAEPPANSAKASEPAQLPIPELTSIKHPPKATTGNVPRAAASTEPDETQPPTGIARYMSITGIAPAYALFDNPRAFWNLKTLAMKWPTGVIKDKGVMQLHLAFRQPAFFERNRRTAATV